MHLGEVVVLSGSLIGRELFIFHCLVQPIIDILSVVSVSNSILQVLQFHLITSTLAIANFK